MSDTEIEDALNISNDKEVKDQLKATTSEANNLGVRTHKLAKMCLAVYIFMHFVIQ